MLFPFRFFLFFSSEDNRYYCDLIVRPDLILMKLVFATFIEA